MRSLLLSSVSSLALIAAPVVMGPVAAAPGTTGPDPVALAEHLSAVKAVYYGSWRCPACQAQTRLFGESAAARLPYVECAKPKELPDQAAACQAAELRAYPTWVLPNGDRRTGVQSLEELQIWTAMPTGQP